MSFSIMLIAASGLALANMAGVLSRAIEARYSIELPAGGRQLLQRGEGVLHSNFQSGGIQPHLREVLSQNFGVAIGLLDTHSQRRGAAQTFQTQCPGAGE